jgi:DNA-binding response OmpR family regulator
MMKKQAIQEKSSILIVDDIAENLRYLSELLTTHGYDVRATIDPEFAIKAASFMHHDLILLDIKMPKMDGYTLSKALRKDEALKNTPIIFISALDEVVDKIKAFESGGVDYITKPFEEQEVLARVDVHIQLHKSKQHIEQLLHQQDYFTKKIMHEMNTPVSIIALNAQVLEAQVGKKSELNTIKASAKILSSIYDDLGYIIKKELHDYEPQRIKLLEFLSDRIAYFHEIAEVKNIELHLEMSSEFIVFMNYIELERLVDNTLSNAIKYSNDNSSIEIFLGKEDENYLLSFTDHGIGIENIDAIFQSYYQESSKNSGLGIGMATVNEICDKYSIKIEIQSEKQLGSTFTYIFDNNIIEEI